MSDDTAVGSEVYRRLGNIEHKIDRIIRVEERQANHSDDLKRCFARVDKCEERVRALEITDGAAAVRTNHNSGAIGMFVSVLISIGVALVAWKMRGG